MDAERRGRFVAYFEGPPLRGDRSQLMRRTGISKGRVTQLLDPDEPFGQKAASSLAVKLGLSADAFERGSNTWTSEQHALEGAERQAQVVAHDLSHLQIEDAPHVEWGEQMTGNDLPPVFWATLPDDSMAPRAAAGKPAAEKV